jgi:hypothetical protein
MYRIMAQHDIKSEFEVWSTFVMHHGGANDYKFHEENGGIAHTIGVCLWGPNIPRRPSSRSITSEPTHDLTIRRS